MPQHGLVAPNFDDRELEIQILEIQDSKCAFGLFCPYISYGPETTAGGILKTFSKSTGIMCRILFFRNIAGLGTALY